MDKLEMGKGNGIYFYDRELNKRIAVNPQTVELCLTVKNLIGDFPSIGKDIDIPIDMNINKYLQDVVKFCENKDIEEAKETITQFNERKKVPKVWEYDEEFFEDFSIEKLRSILNTADYLECIPMITAGAKNLAGKIKGKTPSEIKDILDLK